ncbi:MAG: hypothetical protein H6Q68_492 [Firmicutes bacterium]|nr:hypothetical protein [Bacillota bacterium]
MIGGPPLAKQLGGTFIVSFKIMAIGRQVSKGYGYRIKNKQRFAGICKNKMNYVKID